MHPGQATSRCACPSSWSFGGLQGVARGVGGKKQESPSITSFHYSRAKQESFLVRTRQFT